MALQTWWKSSIDSYVKRYIQIKLVLQVWTVLMGDILRQSRIITGWQFRLGRCLRLSTVVDPAMIAKILKANGQVLKIGPCAKH